MILRFFKHGDGSGQSAVDYLMAEEVPKFDGNRNRVVGQTVKRDPLPECLHGDPEQMALLIDSDHRKWRYTSLVLAFADHDAPTEDEQQEVIQSFEATASAGLARDQMKTLWVRHSHLGNVELHCLVLRKELHHGRALNIAPPGAERYFNAWRDFWNAKKGWADPKALQHQRPLREVVENKDRSELRSYVNQLVIGEIEKGAIKDHADVLAFLQTLEEDGLEMKPLTEKQIARRAKQDEQSKTGGKPRPPDKRLTMRLIGSTGSQDTFRLEDRIYHEQWTSTQYFAGQAARESKRAGERKPRETPERVEELRRAMERAVSRRAEKNRARYGEPTSGRKAPEQSDEGADRGANIGANRNNGQGDQGIELHALEDCDFQRRIIDVGGLRRSARRLRHLWRDEDRATTDDASGNSAGFEREQDRPRDWRPWNHHHLAERRRDDNLPDRHFDGSTVYPEALEEECFNERWSDPVRERIAALRRGFLKADRALGRTLEAVRRRVEAARERFKVVTKSIKLADEDRDNQLSDRKPKSPDDNMDRLGKTGNDPISP
ncbi:hypothetical protein [Tateyamaria sp.]|uniref:hypothetical protein n=1 Tax=Tateyamaria sp. TaxID=1929288 RepID=UPI00329C1C59